MKRWVGFVSILLAIVVSAAIIIESNRRMMEDNRDIARCLVEQMAEHRIDNRGSHEALADQHGDFRERDTSLPDPPATMPAPNPEIKQELLEACEPYLHRSRMPQR